MARCLILAGLWAVTAVPQAARGADAALSEGWIAMAEGCLGYAESGSRAVFDGWPATTPAGPCNGDPVCESDEMIFALPEGRGIGAVTVRVGAADWVGRRYHGSDPAALRVGDAPAHAFCASAPDVPHRTGDIDRAHRLWVMRQRASHRLYPAEGYVSLPAGPYIGCGHDGRRFLVEFSLARPGAAIMRLNYPTRTPALEGGICAGPMS
ncbi:hypothetical protein [Oceaniglobus trochenteri]|uniref:hypothetical protein n=1 Tax=Oceaniglobus trochenteri TaxID=2763260 RepID=UPI001D001997|nr:hypothetical protein [Oceaniglobus trochenteri]